MSVAPITPPHAFPDRAFPNVAAVLINAAKEFPASGVYVRSELRQEIEFLTYPSLVEEAKRVLGGLQKRGLCPGAKIALLLERPRDFISVFWACILGGYIPCPLSRTGGDAERWARHLTYVHDLLDQPIFICTDRSVNDFPPFVQSGFLEDLRKNPQSNAIHTSTPADPAVLMLTSGSTGNSKAVELTHGNILASMAAKAQALQWNPGDIALNWVGFDHVAALLKIHMIALYVGAAQVHVEPTEVLTDPLNFLRLIDRYRITITFTPNFLLGQINAALETTRTEQGQPDVIRLDLSRLRRILVGGEANVVKTGLRFLDLLAPYKLARDALCPAYGLTETCAGIVYSNDFPDRDLDQEFAAAGKPVLGLELRIADEDGNSIESESGEVQVRGPMVFFRYYNNDEATRAAFTADGWFRTGDLGRIDEGQLRILARIKDTIIVSGVNYFSHELETQLNQLEGIERTFVAAFPTRPKGADTEQLVVAFATTLAPTNEAGIYQLAVAVRNTTIMLWGFRPTVILPLPMSGFPKTSLGKIQRSLMRKRFEAGAYAAEIARISEITTQNIGTYVAPENPIETAVTEIYSRILGLELGSLSTTSSFFDLGGTSLDILKLTREIDRVFRKKIELPIIIQAPTTRQLAARLSSDAHGAMGKYDPIVPLQRTGKKPPLFCVHPGNSEVLVLVNLAKYFLNDRPFYAFRPRGFNKGEACFSAVEDFVHSYVEAILDRQPRGPYAIAGYSMGVLIAFEIAKELEARGHYVGFLGLIDYIPHHELRLDYRFIEIATSLAWVLDLIGWEQVQQYRAEAPQAPATLETCEYILRTAPRTRLSELNLDLHQFLVWARVAYTTEKLLYAHPTTGKVRTMTVFCSPSLGYFVQGDEWRNRLRRWDEFTMQPARFVNVPGDHYTLMSPRHVASFQSILRTEIDRAFGTQ